MPKLSRKDATELADHYAQKVGHLIDQDITIVLGPHLLPVHLDCVRLARQADVKNLPDKVAVSGERYTPSLLQFCFDKDSIFVVMDDIKDTAITLSGVDFMMTNHVVRFLLRS